MTPTDDTPDWVDPTPVETWDPWGEPGGSDDQRGLNRTLGEWLEGVVPPDAQLHFFNAGREFAAGVQTTLEYHRRGGADGPDDATETPVRIEIE